MAQLLDPLAWERRLQEARARRAQALANREAARGGRPASDGEDADPAPSLSAAPAARAPIPGDMRLRPAARPAIAETGGGPSIRELAMRNEAPAAPPAGEDGPDPFAFYSLPEQPPARDRIAELPSVLRRRTPVDRSPFAEPDRPGAPPFPETNEGFGETARSTPAAPPEPQPAPASPFTITAPAEPVPARPTAEGPAPGSAPVLTAPPRPAANRRKRRSMSRVAAVFAAGLGLGLVGALALTGPVAERIESVLPAGDDTVASRAAPETPVGAETAGDAVDAPPAAVSTTATAPAPAPDRPETESPAPSEVAALAPPEAAPAVSLPDGAGRPASLPLPTAIPRPEAPGPAGVASVPDWPEALASPGLPVTPDPQSVAGTAPPGSLGLARPLARPGDLPDAAPESAPAIDLAALTPEIPAAGMGATTSAETAEPASAEETPSPAAATSAPCGFSSTSRPRSPAPRQMRRSMRSAAPVSTLPSASTSPSRSATPTSATTSPRTGPPPKPWPRRSAPGPERTRSPAISPASAPSPPRARSRSSSPVSPVGASPAPRRPPSRPRGPRRPRRRMPSPARRSGPRSRSAASPARRNRQTRRRTQCATSKDSPTRSGARSRGP